MFHEGMKDISKGSNLGATTSEGTAILIMFVTTNTITS